jgi:chromosome segregation ATPase
MDTHPTDLAIHALNSYKPILVSAADILEKKYPDMQPNGSELRAINREIIEKIKSGDYALKMHKYGDISKEQLTKNYIGELTKTIPSSNNELDTCKTDLRIAEDKRTKLDNDNEYLRKNNEKLRDEIRRGLTSYTTETLLRDCREENERLKRVKPADDREIREIREIANMLQNEVNRCENLKATYESQIRTLQKELGETQEALKDVLG